MAVGVDAEDQAGLDAVGEIGFRQGIVAELVEAEPLNLDPRARAMEWGDAVVLPVGSEVGRKVGARGLDRLIRDLGGDGLESSGCFLEAEGERSLSQSGRSEAEKPQHKGDGQGTHGRESSWPETG